MPQDRSGSARPSPTPVLRTCTSLESPPSRAARSHPISACDLSQGQPNAHVDNIIDRDLREASSLATRLRRQIAEEQHRSLIERSLLTAEARRSRIGTMGTMGGQGRAKSRTKGVPMSTTTCMSSDEAERLIEQRKMETLLANQRKRIQVLSSGCGGFRTAGMKKGQSEQRPVSHSCPQQSDSCATRKTIHVDSNTTACGTAVRSSAKQLSAVNVYNRIRAVAEETRTESVALRAIQAEQRAYFLEKNRAMVSREHSLENNGMCSSSQTTNPHSSLPLREGGRKGREAMLKKKKELHDEVLLARKATRKAQLSEALEEVRRLKTMLEEASLA